MPPAADDRVWIERFVFGPESARRFTQDSPVLPDVWIAYAMNPGGSLELLLTPNMEPTTPGGATTTGRLRKALAERLPVERARTASWCLKETGATPHVELAHNQATVLARLWFDEFVRVVLPMSTWWFERVHGPGFDAQLGQLTTGQISQYAEMLANPNRSAKEMKIPANKKPSPDLLWMVRVVGAIALTWKEPQAAKAMWTAPTLTLDDFEKIIVAANNLFHEVVAPKYGETALVFCVSQNRKAQTTVEGSRQAVKADAAKRLFDMSCATLTWAVIDSGVDAEHPAFRQLGPNGKPFAAPFKKDARSHAIANHSRVRGTFDFNYIELLLSTDPGADAQLPDWLQNRLHADPALATQLSKFRAGLNDGAEIDWAQLVPFLQIPHEPKKYQAPLHDHGTHVAGIIAANWDPPASNSSGEPMPPPGGIHGICPDIQLFDLRVLNAEGMGEEFNIISALQFVRYLNGRQDIMAIHGVNLSLSLQHDVVNYACGRTPICLECERLVGSGVVVVAAAGNRGFQKYMVAGADGPLESYHSISITDPGNADGVITVGSTHRSQPHAYGVSYFSSRGPTGDGRTKPDLVAPGEKIEAPVPGGGYKRMDGTSMAAPHVSGVAALVLARYRELIGLPAQIKKILCQSATDLGRESFFQGHGMVDALRALQSV